MTDYQRDLASELRTANLLALLNHRLMIGEVLGAVAGEELRFRVVCEVLDRLYPEGQPGHRPRVVYKDQNKGGMS